MSEKSVAYAYFQAFRQSYKMYIVAFMPRPFELDPLFRAITTLSGVGPKNGKLLEKLTGGTKVLDILHHKPVDFVDRRFSPKLKDAPDEKSPQ